MLILFCHNYSHRSCFVYFLLQHCILTHSIAIRSRRERILPTFTMRTSTSAKLLCLMAGLALLSSSVNAKDDPKKFQAAIDKVSDQCKLVSAACFQNSDKVKQLFASRKFCDMMNYKDGQTSTKACLTATNGCTTDEYNKIKDAACGATSLVVSLAAVVIGVVASMFGK